MDFPGRPRMVTAAWATTASSVTPGGRSFSLVLVAHRFLAVGLHHVMDVVLQKAAFQLHGVEDDRGIHEREVDVVQLGHSVCRVPLWQLCGGHRVHRES